MSETKNFTIIKTTPGTVLFDLHPVSNPMLTRRVQLTDKAPKQPVPLDWALGVFQDSGVYSLYANKLITFDKNDIIAKAAFEAGVYFDEKLDFEPAKQNRTQTILTILQSGNRANIMKAIDEEGHDAVKEVAMANVDGLTNAVIKMLESIFKIQLTIDGE